MTLEIQRGEMYYAHLGPSRGAEQSGYRPILVIQNDVGNQHSRTVIIAAITGRAKKPVMPTHCHLPAANGLKMPSIVLLEQIRTIDKSRLRRYVGRLDDIMMKGIDRGIAVSLGIGHEEAEQQKEAG